MHMTGMESFNVASKRGPAAIPMGSTATGSSQPSSNINDSSSQVVIDSRTITTNKSSMQAILNNKNKNQPGKAAAPANASQGVKSNQSASTGLDQKEKKIYEIYASSGKVMAPIGANNFNQNSSQNNNQNAFLQNKY